MSTATDQLARLLVLVPWLRDHPGVSTEVVVEAFGITRAQLEADLKLLIVCGVPGGMHDELFDIDFFADDVEDDDDDDVHLGSTITVLDAQTLDRAMRLKPGEAVTLLLGLRLLAELPGSFERRRIDALAARLESLAGDALDSVEGTVAIDAGQAIDESVESAISYATSRNRRLDLRYYVPSRDEVTVREVDPLSQLLADGHRYLVAWCHQADERRTFRMDRIESATVSDRPADEHPIEVRDATAQRVRYSSTPSAATVIVDLEPSAQWILDHAVVDATESEPDGTVRATLTTHSEQWVAQLILRAGPGARVIEPASLRALVRDQALAALAVHARAQQTAG